MKSNAGLWISAVILGSLLISQAPAADRPLAHIVYFKLKESTPDSREELIAGCRKYLGEHEGTVHFSVGVLAEELDREVNDRDFDVVLMLVFGSKAAHDVYQTHPRHLKFIEECEDLWDDVRVFDSYLVTAPGGKPYRQTADAAPDRPAKRIALPDPAAFFAGMIAGKVVEKRDGRIVVEVTKVTRQWKHSRAKDAQAMVGKRVLVSGLKAEPIKRFVARLDVGEMVELDVANREGEELEILELTASQREGI